MRATEPSFPTIVCPIDLFNRVESEIEDLSSALNRAPTVSEKEPLARELRHAVSVLLECKAYNNGNANCLLCRQFSTLRDMTVAIVEQAARLPR